MSDANQGPGWWLASDGKWYPPQSAAGAAAPPPPGSAPPAAAKTGMPGCLKWGLVGLVIAAVLGVGCVAMISDGGDEVSSDNGPEPAGESSTTEPSDQTATTAELSGPATAPSLVISGTVTIPEGEKGKLSIVLTGKAVQGDGSVPVIVRNYTADTIHGLEVTGTARSKDGSLAGSGSSQGFTPAVVRPGEWAFGYVYFDGEVPSDSTFDLTAKGHTEEDFFGGVDAKIAEHNVVPGDFGTTMVGIVANETKEEISGPVSVDVMCFDQSGTAPLSTHRGYADSDPIPPDGTSSFSVDLFEDDPCTNYAMGASGYTG